MLEFRAHSLSHLHVQPHLHLELLSSTLSSSSQHSTSGLQLLPERPLMTSKQLRRRMPPTAAFQPAAATLTALALWMLSLDSSTSKTTAVFRTFNLCRTHAHNCLSNQFLYFNTHRLVHRHHPVQEFKQHQQQQRLYIHSLYTFLIDEYLSILLPPLVFDVASEPAFNATACAASLC